MKYNLVFAIPLVLLVVGCGQQNQKSASSSTEEAVIPVDSAMTFDEEEIEEIEETERSDDEIREYGIIIGIEDSGYPRHIITIEFPEREMKNDFNLNVESGVIDYKQLIALKDQYITFYYTSELKPNLHDIHYNGSTLLGEYAPEPIDGLKQITGSLSGAEEETYADLPDEVTVTSEAGETVSFSYFVTEEMAKVNGQQVTVFYTLRGVETITGIEASEE